MATFLLEIDVPSADHARVLEDLLREQGIDVEAHSVAAYLARLGMADIRKLLRVKYAALVEYGRTEMLKELGEYGPEGAAGILRDGDGEPLISWAERKTEPLATFAANSHLLDDEEFERLAGFFRQDIIEAVETTEEEEEEENT